MSSESACPLCYITRSFLNFAVVGPGRPLGPIGRSEFRTRTVRSRDCHIFFRTRSTDFTQLTKNGKKIVLCIYNLHDYLRAKNQRFSKKFLQPALFSFSGSNRATCTCTHNLLHYFSIF